MLTHNDESLHPERRGTWTFLRWQNQLLLKHFSCICECFTFPDCHLGREEGELLVSAHPTLKGKSGLGSKTSLLAEDKRGIQEDQMHFG